MTTNLHVLHITEASSAGVLHAAGQLARLQSDLGAQVSFRYIRRPDSPDDSAFQQLLGNVKRDEFGSSDMGARERILHMRRAVAAAFDSNQFDIIHSHSSLAGVAARTARRGRNDRTAIAYSPHGFAFLRQDVIAPLRWAYASAERLLAKRGSLIVASPSEFDAARSLRPRHAFTLLNGVVADEAPAQRENVEGRKRVGMIGRVAYQKAPWRFATVARALSDQAEFVWIGDGAPEDRAKWLDSSPVNVTGWLPRDAARSAIADLDIVLFPTLWEGMPLALLDAQLSGVPAVASNVVGNMDVVIDNETGFLADDDEALLEGVSRLLEDDQLRTRMGQAARRHVTDRFDARKLAAESLVIYAGLLNATGNQMRRAQ